MNRIELEAAIAEKTGIDKKVVKEVLNNQLDIIMNTLSEGDNVKISGFGTYFIKKLSARVGKNPKTGEKINIPASKKVVLKAGKSLSNLINP